MWPSAPALWVRGHMLLSGSVMGESVQARLKDCFIILSPGIDLTSQNAPEETAALWGAGVGVGGDVGARGMVGRPYPGSVLDARRKKVMRAPGGFTAGCNFPPTSCEMEERKGQRRLLTSALKDGENLPPPMNDGCLVCQNGDGHPDPNLSFFFLSRLLFLLIPAKYFKPTDAIYL